MAVCDVHRKNQDLQPPHQSGGGAPRGQSEGPGRRGTPGACRRFQGLPRGGRDVPFAGGKLRGSRGTLQKGAPCCGGLRHLQAESPPGGGPGKQLLALKIYTSIIS